nr:trypsin-like peptidase domain-containing protein [Desulfobulbaceae bacterium]
MIDKKNLITKVPWLIIIALAIIIFIVVLENIGPVGNSQLANPVAWQPMPPQFHTVQPAQIPQAGQVQAQGTQPSTAMQVQEGISQAIAMVRPSVVAILTPENANTPPDNTGIAFIQPYTKNGKAQGSGVIISPQGHILTTFQAVGQATEVTVQLFSRGKRRHIADVVSVDAATDLALLKIRATESFPAAMLGNSDFIETGDMVLAIGSPYGFSRSATLGIISSSRRHLNINGINYPDLIQTDAAINDGENGGPLVNVKGEIIGINMAYYIPGNHFSGIGFAIPINDARRVFNM